MCIFLRIDASPSFGPFLSNNTRSITCEQASTCGWYTVSWGSSTGIPASVGTTNVPRTLKGWLARLAHRMMGAMRVYLDVCCLSRPFADQSQERIRIESEAVWLILDLCSKGVHRWASSTVVEEEVSRNPDADE